MHQIKKMLRLNLEIEGCLRILLDRPNAEAEEILLDKLDQLRALALEDQQPGFEIEKIEIKEEIENLESLENLENLEEGEKPEEPENLENLEKAEEPERLESALARQSASCFAKAFSINDKYRFIREIFDGSAPAFNNAIDMVGAMQSLDEAYDYFLNDLGWDADNEAVSDFLVIVANHFNSAQ